MNLILLVQGFLFLFLSFNRKRHSVIVKNEDNEIYLFIKGADSEISKRLH